MESSVLKKFTKHSVVFREGDHGDEMYIVHSGKVRLIKQIQRKYEELGTLQRGDFFGEMVLIEPESVRAATAIILEDDTTLVTVRKDQFEKMLQTNVEIALRMIRQYAKRLIETNDRLERLLHDQQTLDSGIQDILSNVRKKSEPEEDLREVFGWLHQHEQNVRFSLKRPEVLIGRADANTKFNPTLDLTAIDQHRTVSRRHARISCLEEGVYLAEEPGVVNGTLVNGVQVEQGKIIMLYHQDKVQLGKLEFEFLLPLRTPQA